MVLYGPGLFGVGALLHLFDIPCRHVLLRIRYSGNNISPCKTARRSSRSTRKKISRPGFSTCCQSRSKRNSTSSTRRNLIVSKHTLSKTKQLLTRYGVDFLNPHLFNFLSSPSFCVTNISIPHIPELPSVSFPQVSICWSTPYLPQYGIHGLKFGMEFPHTEVGRLLVEKVFPGRHREVLLVRKEHPAELHQVRRIFEMSKLRTGAFDRCDRSVRWNVEVVVLNVAVSYVVCAGTLVSYGWIQCVLLSTFLFGRVSCRAIV